MSTTKRKGLLERLAEGPVLGDGGMMFGLEKRGYVKAGVWTPECTVLYPEAVRQLHREHLRSGADVIQALNFGSSASRLSTKKIASISGRDINLAAYNLAREVADENNALVSISLSETQSYRQGKDKDVILGEYKQQLSFFKHEKCDIDFIVCEYIHCIEEMEWAIAAAKEYGVPVVATMCIGPKTDRKGVPTGQCAVRMAQAGADVVGINCNFGPNVALKSMRVMKQELEKENLTPFLICQPLGYFTPEVETGSGYVHLPEHFLAPEPRTLTRFEAQKYAREAHELGIRYIGACCGFEPYHIRAMSEELFPERKKIAPVTEEYGDILSGIREGPTRFITERSDAEIWKSMEPSTGRPKSAAFAKQLYFP